MENRQALTKRLCTLDPSLTAEDIFIAYGYDLLPDDSYVRCDGIAAFLRDRFLLYRDGKRVLDIPHGEIDSFTFRQGIGCVFTEYKDKGGADHILCRGAMQYLDTFAAVIKEMNRYLEGKPIHYEYEKELDRVCPKCGRPYRAGSTICDFCVDKKSYLKRLWQVAHPYRFYIYGSIAFYFVIALFNLLPPYLNRVLVDDFIQADTKPVATQFVLVLVSILAVHIFANLLSIIRSILLIKASNKLVVRMREMIFNKIQMLSISRISKRTAGELMNRVSGDTRQLTQFLTGDLGDIIEQAVTLIAVSAILFAYDWRLALMILLPAPIVMYTNRLFWSFMGRMYHRQWTLESRSSTILHDIFSGIRVVKAFGMEHRETERFDKVIAEQRDTSIRNERFYGVFSPIMSFFMGIGEFFLLYYVGNRILGGTMTIGEMSQFSAYVGIIYGPLRWMSTFPRRFVRFLTSVVKIFDVIDEDPEIKDKSDAVDHKIEGYITFDHVSFGYNNTTNVLRDINVEIKPGEMIGIVGKSGVGKSTLINLVMRMYDVNEGSLKIDGIDIRDISQDSLRSQIGVVLQETFLFSGTIYDNIAYAKPSATPDEVITAAKLAGAHQFIMKLPNAYNTKVGERGHTLSGGERQRVAIARALLHNPRILILDEATASLDTETEKQIQDALQQLIADRTTLAIAHRLSTLRNATRILVLDKGELVEIDTHEELMRKKGIYYGLVMAQRQMSKMPSKNRASSDGTEKTASDAPAEAVPAPANG